MTKTHAPTAAATVHTRAVNELRVRLQLQLLDGAVWLWIAQLRALDDATFALRWAYWTNAVMLDVAGVFSEVLPAGGGKLGEGARAFNALAQAIAALAFVPGGVTFGARHYQANREPAATAASS
ncbi:MAG: hypothetical protein ABI606_16070 [Rhodoferax sp.]